MPEYQSISVKPGLRDRLQEMAAEDRFPRNATYSDVIEQLIRDGEMLERLESNQSQMMDLQKQMVRMNVRMAAKMDLNKEQIPRGLAEAEASGSGGAFAPPGTDEEITDVYADEKMAEHQAMKEVKNLEPDEDGFLRPADEEQARIHGHSEETQEKIEQRKQEILEAQATDDEGWTDGFNNDADNDNGDDN